MMQKEAASLDNAGGQIIYRFDARDLHLVMGPVTPGNKIRFRVYIDGQPPGAEQGVDVDSKGNGIIREHRLYQLIRQQGPVVDREFEIEFLDIGAEAFSFTYG
jgi:hypothetical protein